MDNPFINFGELNMKELPYHRNIGMEVVCVIEGMLRWKVDGKEETLHPGSVFFTLPWQAHGSMYEHEPGNRISFVQFRLDRTYDRPVKKFAFHPALDIPQDDAHRLSRVFTETDCHTWPGGGELAAVIRMLVRQLSDDGKRLCIQGLFRCLIAELAGVISGPAKGNHFLNPSERRVWMFLNELKKRCAEPWTLQEMSEKCSLKRTQMTEICKKLTGDSPVDHLRRIRVYSSEALLRTTNRTATEIAFECGFQTSQDYCRTFKKFTNRTPTEYRRQSRARSDQPVMIWTEEDEKRRMDLVRDRKWI